MSSGNPVGTVRVEQGRRFSEACERNRDPILAGLRVVFADRHLVLEIGSGTGQHAAYFARHLPHLIWQPSDIDAHLPGIRSWTDEAALPNLCDPVALDINQPAWPDTGADAVFTANTLHIVSWPVVERLFERVASLLPADGMLAVYGPFNYRGRFTSDSNAAFDAMLRAREPASGIRDFEAVDRLARQLGFASPADLALPANNRLIVWQRKSGRSPPLVSRL